MFPVTIAARFLLSCVHVWRERGDRCVKKPAKPNAFAFAEVSDSIHTVVPIAAAHQRQTMLADREAAIDSTRAMFVNRCRLFGHRWLRVVLQLISCQQRLFEEG